MRSALKYCEAECLLDQAHSRNEEMELWCNTSQFGTLALSWLARNRRFRVTVRASAEGRPHEEGRSEARRADNRWVFSYCVEEKLGRHHSSHSLFRNLVVSGMEQS